jgi:hypothetical protein
MISVINYRQSNPEAPRKKIPEVPYTRRSMGLSPAACISTADSQNISWNAALTELDGGGHQHE